MGLSPLQVPGATVCRMHHTCVESGWDLALPFGAWASARSTDNLVCDASAYRICLIKL